MTIYSKIELREQIIDIVCKLGEVKIKKNKYKEIEKEIFDHIARLIIQGHRVPIGSFGYFYLRDQKARMVNHPRKKESTLVKPTTFLKFKKGTTLSKIDQLEIKVGTKKDDGRNKKEAEKPAGAGRTKDKEAGDGDTAKSKTAHTQKIAPKRNR